IQGFVPNLSEFFETMTISVVPTFHGTGLINRILDSLCASIPTVTTRQAAATFEGLKAGEHLLVSDDAKEFAKHVKSLLGSRESRLKISKRGKEYTLNFPDWNQTADKVERALKEI